MKQKAQKRNEHDIELSSKPIVFNMHSFTCKCGTTTTDLLSNTLICLDKECKFTDQKIANEQRRINDEAFAKEKEQELSQYKNLPAKIANDQYKEYANVSVEVVETVQLPGSANDRKQMLNDFLNFIKSRIHYTQYDYRLTAEDFIRIASTWQYWNQTGGNVPPMPNPVQETFRDNKQKQFGDSLEYCLKELSTIRYKNDFLKRTVAEQEKTIENLGKVLQTMKKEL